MGRWNMSKPAYKRFTTGSELFSCSVASWRPTSGRCKAASASKRQRLSSTKLYVAERYASKEYLSETKREILDSIRDLARRIEHP